MGNAEGKPLRTDQTDKDKAERGAMCQGKPIQKEGWWSHGGVMAAEWRPKHCSSVCKHFFDFTKIWGERRAKDG